MDKKSIVNNLYQERFAIGYLMFGTKILKMTPPRYLGI